MFKEKLLQNNGHGVSQFTDDRILFFFKWALRQEANSNIHHFPIHLFLEMATGHRSASNTI